MKYISFDKRWRTYVIYKKIKGKQYNFGSYNSLEDAKNARDYFEKEGWENCIHKRLQFTNVSNLEKSNGKWTIVKQSKGKRTTYGRFDSYEEAAYERDLLKQCGWDIDALCNIDERTSGTIFLENKPIGVWK